MRAGTQEHSRLASKEALKLGLAYSFTMKNSSVHTLQTLKAFGCSVSKIGN